MSHPVSRRALFFGAAPALVLLCLLSGANLSARAAPGPAGAAPVTEAPANPGSLVGESWIRHLNLSLDDTSLGKMGGWGPSVETSAGASSSTTQVIARPEALDAPFHLTGRDLYRLSCQGCHRGDGSGAPPEILPITGLARATSRQFFRDKMKERGLPVDESQLAQNTAQAEKSLRDRIRNGGEKMPPFPHLDRAETLSLIAYVKELSGVREPGPGRPPVSEPITRVGELLVKGTCHICHDSWSAPTFTYQYRGAEPGNPPPLSSFTEQRTCPQVIRKVREGLVDPSMSASRGRMPVFDYLSPQEVTAAYFYLLVEPPGRSPGDGAIEPAHLSISTSIRR